MGGGARHGTKRIPHPARGAGRRPRHEQARLRSSHQHVVQKANSTPHTTSLQPGLMCGRVLRPCETCSGTYHPKRAPAPRGSGRVSVEAIADRRRGWLVIEVGAGIIEFSASLTFLSASRISPDLGRMLSIFGHARSAGPTRYQLLGLTLGGQPIVDLAGYRKPADRPGSG